MEEGSAVLEAMNQLEDEDGICSWGARFDLNGPEAGYGVFLNGLLSGIMDNVEHDLIVPTESALGFGTSQAKLSCSHSDYFRQTLVRLALSQSCPGMLS